MAYKIKAMTAAFLVLGSAVPVFAADAGQSKEGAAYIKEIADQLGIELVGYARGGFYPKSDGMPAGNYTLGGNLQKYRLGNEGDNYIEFGIGKTFKLSDGIKWGVHYMPYVYNGSKGTKQFYTTLSGVDFLPEATYWAGQRYHRLEDIHIVDKWIMEDGDNFGAGVDNINVGFGKLNIAAHTSGSIDNDNDNANNARRLSFQWHDMPINPGGKLSLTGSIVRGDFEQGSSGSAWGIRHNQALSKNWNNSLFLQTSSGHADINGKFYGLDTRSSSLVVSGSTVSTITLITPQDAAKQNRIVDSMSWQYGKFGGQALIGYETTKVDGGDKIKDFSVGGRASYAIARHAKLIGELGVTSRKGAGERQTLNKGTIALALAPNGDFWSRPEVRLYVTRAGWNKAAASANASTFGEDGKTSNTIVGVQMEAWW